MGSKYADDSQYSFFMIPFLSPTPQGLKDILDASHSKEGEI